MDVMEAGSDLYNSAAYWLVNNPSDAFLVVLFLAILLAVLGVSAMIGNRGAASRRLAGDTRSEEHTSELQSLMRISYAVFCLKKKNPTIDLPNRTCRHE